jgi:hypothetical protein
VIFNGAACELAHNNRGGPCQQRLDTLINTFMKCSDFELTIILEKIHEIRFDPRLKQGLTHLEVKQLKIESAQQSLVRNHQQAYKISSKCV